MSQRADWKFVPKEMREVKRRHAIGETSAPINAKVVVPGARSSWRSPAI
jgi:hypothetical protein